MTGIYFLFNKITGITYVGSAVSFSRRKTAHYNDLRRNIHKNTHLQNAWNKYGESNFQFIIVEECSREDLLVREQHYLTVIPRQLLYNFCLTAGSRIGHTPSPETRRKISESMKGKQNCLGKTQTEATRLKRSDSVSKTMSKPFCVMKDGVIYEGLNINAFCREHKLLPGTFCNMLAGRIKSYKGFKVNFLNT